MQIHVQKQETNNLNVNKQKINNWTQVIMLQNNNPLWETTYLILHIIPRTT